MTNRLFFASLTVGALAIASCGTDPVPPPAEDAAAASVQAAPTSTTVIAGGRDWSVAVGDEPGDLTTDGRTVFVAAGSRVLALDVADGARRWTARLAGFSSRGDGPALGSDFVVVEGAGLLYVLEQTDGSTRWRGTTEFRGQPVVIGTPGNELVVGTDLLGGRIAAFDAKDGAPRWAVTFPGVLVRAPVDLPDAGSVVAIWEPRGAQAVMRSFDIDTGALRWEQSVGAGASPPGVAGPDLVVVGHGVPGGGEVRAVDARTGEVRWRTPWPTVFWAMSGPATEGGSIAIADQLGGLGLLDRTDGHVRWRVQTGAPPVVDPAMSAERVVIASYGGGLVVAARRDGQVLVREPGARVFGGLVVTGGSAVAAVALVPSPFVESRRLP